MGVDLRGDAVEGGAAAGVLGGVVEVGGGDLGVGAAGAAHELGDRVEMAVDVRHAAALAHLAGVELEGEGTGPAGQVGGGAGMGRVAHDHILPYRRGVTGAGGDGLRRAGPRPGRR